MLRLTLFGMDLDLYSWQGYAQLITVGQIQFWGGVQE